MSMTEDNSSSSSSTIESQSVQLSSSLSPSEADQVIQIFDTILTNLPNNIEDEEARKTFYDFTTLAFLQLKVTTRNLHSKLDDHRKQLEQKKLAIDQLQLSYENVLYRKAYLNREIQSCYDFHTPHLHSIEEEIHESLGTLTYTSHLSEMTIVTKQKLENEMKNRQYLKRQLEDIQKEYQSEVEILEKKKKFFAELPRRVAAIKSVAVELRKQLQGQEVVTAYLESNKAVVESEESNTTTTTLLLPAKEEEGEAIDDAGGAVMVSGDGERQEGGGEQEK